MKTVITGIIIFGLVVALIMGAVIPLLNEVKDTGSKSFESVKNTNNNITTN